MRGGTLSNELGHWSEGYVSPLELQKTLKAAEPHLPAYWFNGEYSASLDELQYVPTELHNEYKAH